MYNAPHHSKDDLPSHAQLGRSTIYAAVIASVLTVTVVVPAEFGRDPTGIGSMLGLTAMGEIKQGLAREASQGERPVDEVPVVTATAAPSTPSEMSLASGGTFAASGSVQSVVATPKRDQMVITLAPNEKAEVKVDLKKGGKVSYEWTSTGRTNFDNHGDSKELSIDYHGYSKGSKDRDEGVITAEFTGNHGWYWRNRTTQTVTITFSASGEYSKATRTE